MTARTFLCTLVAILAAGTIAASDVKRTKLSEKKLQKSWNGKLADFRGVPFGSTEAEAQKILGRMKCRSSQPNEPLPAHRVCVTSDKSRAYRIRDVVVLTWYHFFEGGFVGASFSGTGGFVPEPLPFEMVVKEFESAYGKPGRQTEWHHVGLRKEQTTVPSVNGTYRQMTLNHPIDFTSTCYEWLNQHAHVSICSEGTLMQRGVIETAGWRQAKRDALLEQLD